MKSFKERVYEVIADPPEGDTFGKFINGFILVVIAVNVFVGIMETVKPLHALNPAFFYWFEVVCVVIFTVEYVLRIWSCTCREEFRHPLKGRYRQATQPMILIDFLAIAPFYVELLLPTGIDLRFIRILRLFRLFRIFRMGGLVKALSTLAVVFKRKKEELSIAVAVLGIVVVLAASLMYLAEGDQPDTKFTSIPASMWWAMITVTTIGYGDMFPTTALGQFLGALIGFAGVCVFALPVAILGAGFIEETDPDFVIGSAPTEEASDTGDPGSGALQSAPMSDEMLDELADRVAARILAKMEESRGKNE